MQLRLVFEVRGEGTEAQPAHERGARQRAWSPGARIRCSGKQVLFIGGGIGVPPLLWAAKRAGSADAALGFAAENRAILMVDFAKVCGEAALATDDGSLGRKGTALDAARELLEKNEYDLIVLHAAEVLKYAAQAAEEAGDPPPGVHGRTHGLRCGRYAWYAL